MSVKRNKQLGINHSTAQQRLLRDILFNLVKDERCFRCGELMTRDTFSVEHKTPWLDSEDPLKLFFDLGNIAFSHQRCNAQVARKPHKKYSSVQEGRRVRAQLHRDRYGHNIEKRQERYQRLGK